MLTGGPFVCHVPVAVQLPMLDYILLMETTYFYMIVFNAMTPSFRVYPLRVDFYCAQMAI